jgi:hypothetical protein
MNLRRLLSLAVVAAAVCTASLTSPAHAIAHSGDPLHQHGWTATARMFDPSPARCFSAPLYNGVGTFSVAVPDLMTTPGGGNQWVAFRASLEYLDGSTWRNTYFDGSTWKYMPYTTWYYNVANSSGLVGIWREFATGRLGPGRIGFDVYPGYTYRVHLYYYWYVDGHTDHEVTTTCAVSRLAGAKADNTKGKRSRPAPRGRLRGGERTPGTVPGRVAVGG